MMGNFKGKLSALSFLVAAVLLVSTPDALAARAKKNTSKSSKTSSSKKVSSSKSAKANAKTNFKKAQAKANLKAKKKKGNKKVQAKATKSKVVAKQVVKKGVKTTKVTSPKSKKGSFTTVTKVVTQPNGLGSIEQKNFFHQWEHSSFKVTYNDPKQQKQAQDVSGFLTPSANFSHQFTKPDAKFISDQGGSVLSNQGGRILTNNGGGVVSTGGGR